MNYAIWCAVSTAAQAKDDRVSLEEQEKRCKAYAAAQGWQEAAGPFVAAGYSRSGYFNLSDAAADIPALAQLLDCLPLFDVLLLYSYDRMGDVLPMLSVYFRQNKKQILSISQLSQIQQPDKFDPYADEGGDIMQDVARITQRFRISSFRRGWRSGVPARVDHGLHPLGSVNYGYALAGERQPAVQVPEETALLHQMKDWMLSGVTYAEICRRADAIHPPRRGKTWKINVVRRMLTNPYYAGFVRFGGGRLVGGKRIATPPSQWKVNQGRHIPLWDEDTYRALVAEAKRRKEGKRNFNAKYPFSGLTYCAVCGEKVRKHGHPPFEYLTCDTHKTKRGSGHFSMRYEKALELISRELVRQLREYQEQPPQPADLKPLQARLAELKTLRARVQDGYEKGLYDAQEASSRLEEIESEGESLARKLEQAKDNEQTRAEWRAKMDGMKNLLEELPYAIREGEPGKMNQLLSSMIAKVVLQGETVRFEWRE